MSQVTIDIPEPLDRFIEDQVASGAYPDREEVVRASLRRFKSQSEAEATRTERFLAAVEVGLTQMAQGETIPVDDITALLDQIEREIDVASPDRAA